MGFGHRSMFHFNLPSQFSFRKFSLGFTIVELLVAISIVAILSAIGLSMYRNVRQDTTDAKKRADVDAIALAYETTYDSENGLYRALTSSDFISGQIPVPPEGGSYQGLISGGQTTATYNVCATLKDNTTYCKSSEQEFVAAISGSVPINSPTARPSFTPTPTTITTSVLTGLISYWRLDETVGTTASDCMARNNGLVTGATSTTGRINRGRLFTRGANHSIIINDQSSLDLTGRVTLQAWVNPSSISSTNDLAIITKGNLTGGNAAYALLQQTDGKVRFQIGNGTLSTSVISTSALSTGQWTHIIGISWGTLFQLFINGELNSSVQQNFTPYANNQHLYIGSSPQGVSYTFGGVIDEVGIWDRALQPAEVSYLYGEGGNGRQACTR